jgi:hypothetical protein
MTWRHVDNVHWCCSLSTDVSVLTHRKGTCRVLLQVSAAWSWRQHHDSDRCAAVFIISFVSTVLLSLRHVADIVSWRMPVCGLPKSSPEVIYCNVYLALEQLSPHCQQPLKNLFDVSLILYTTISPYAIALNSSCVLHCNYLSATALSASRLALSYWSHMSL